MNYGIFGVGRIGKVHASILLDQGHKITAMGDEKEAALSVAKVELDIATVETFNSPEDMIKQAGNDIDAVVIASHSKDHARHALPFVQAQIPIYLEKPLTERLDETFDFLQTIGRNEHLLQIGLQRRFDPPLLHAKDLLKRGLIGHIREIRCVLRDQFPPPATYVSRGLVIDMGIHLADEAIFFLDEFPNEVWASQHHTKGYESQLEEGGDTAYVTFTTPSSVVGRLDLSRTHSSGYNNETYIIGTEGTLHVGRFAGYPGPIHVELWSRDGRQNTSSKTFEMAHITGVYPEFLPRFDAAYRRAHCGFREALETGQPFAVTQNHVLDAQVFTEAAHRSAQNEGRHYEPERFDNLQQYRAACISNGLMDG